MPNPIVNSIFFMFCQVGLHICVITIERDFELSDLHLYFTIYLGLDSKDFELL